jgi:hypothetical protein
MKIYILLQQTHTDNTIFCQVTRRIRFALSQVDRSIRIMTIRIVDINDLKGEVHVRCVISVKLTSTREIRVQSNGKDIFSALNSCLSHASTMICKSIERHRDTPIRTNRQKSKIQDEILLLENQRDKFSF